jgi:hypothetical protein
MELFWIWLQSGWSQSYDFFDLLPEDFQSRRVATIYKVPMLLEPTSLRAKDANELNLFI